MKISIAGATLAAAVAATASADVTYTFTGSTWAGFNFTQVAGPEGALGFLQGTLTGVSVNATLNASAGFAYADDLCIYIDVLPLSGGGLLQVGGFSNLNAAQRLGWANGASATPGTTVIDSRSVNPIVFSGTASDAAVWLGNGYGGTGSSGTWTGSITLVGVNAVPAPGAIALLGLAGFAGRRRRA